MTYGEIWSNKITLYGIDNTVRNSLPYLLPGSVIPIDNIFIADVASSKGESSISTTTSQGWYAC